MLDGGDGDGDENMNVILGVLIEVFILVDVVFRVKCFWKTKTIVDFFGVVAKVKSVINVVLLK